MLKEFWKHDCVLVVSFVFLSVFALLLFGFLDFCFFCFLEAIFCAVFASLCLFSVSNDGPVLRFVCCCPGKLEELTSLCAVPC